MTEKKHHIDFTKKEKKKNTQHSVSKIIIKIILILIITYGFYVLHNSYSNSITLLAVSEDQNGNAQGGSKVTLSLEITPGSGQVFTNLNTIEEIDTQISIINSQKIACNIFSLPCEKYNFYYTFTDSAIILKGPSASSAIAILTTKTVLREKIDQNTVITGSLNSGGIIGTVGGIKEKIAVAKENNYSKILIPKYSDYVPSNETIDNQGIEIVYVFDLVDAYNNFDGPKYELKTPKIDNTEYKTEMEKLSNSICLRSDKLRNEINFLTIKPNTTLEIYKNQAIKSVNNSENALAQGNFYSRGSFCYNVNLNYRLIIETENNLSLEERNIELEKLKKEINLKFVTLMSNEYKTENIKTTNDFYVYMLMLNRIEEARNYIKEAEKLKLEIIEINETNNQTSSNINIAAFNLEKTQNIQIQKSTLYSYATERYYTVLVWENFITHTGSIIKFNEEIISESCHKINKEISIKSELLNNYGINYLNTEVEKQKEFQNPFSNKYQCLYSGFELNAKMNTLLNSFGVNENNQKNYTINLYQFASSRVTLNSNGNFPLIPYMYSEYAKDLYDQNDFGSSMLYSNYALSYADLNLYLEGETKNISKVNSIFEKIFSNTLFVIAILLLVVFL